MDKVTQSNAASSEESASASQELSQQAQSIRQLIHSLHDIVGGESHHATAVPLPLSPSLTVASNPAHPGQLAPR